MTYGPLPFLGIVRMAARRTPVVFSGPLLLRNIPWAGEVVETRPHHVPWAVKMAETHTLQVSSNPSTNGSGFRPQNTLARFRSSPSLFRHTISPKRLTLSTQAPTAAKRGVPNLMAPALNSRVSPAHARIKPLALLGPSSLLNGP